MHRFLALWHARNLEFFRDRASFGWAMLFPVMAIVACAFAFSSEREQLLEVGLLGDGSALEQRLPLLGEPWVKLTHYQDEAHALERLRHHQLHLLLADAPQRYWVNTESSRSLVAERLLLAEGEGWTQQTVSGRSIRYVDWVVPGVLGMNLMFSALFGVGYTIVRYRQSGVLKRLQATPVTPLEFVTAQLASRLGIILFTNLLLFIGALWLLDLVMLGSYGTLLVVAATGALAMLSVGLLIASRTTSEEAANGMINLFAWPMMFFSEVWFSLEGASPWMQQFSNLLPLTHLVRAAREVMTSGATLAEVTPHLLYLLGITAVLLVLATRLFRWSR